MQANSAANLVVDHVLEISNRACIGSGYLDVMVRSPLADLGPGRDLTFVERDESRSLNEVYQMDLNYH